MCSTKSLYDEDKGNFTSYVFLPCTSNRCSFFQKGRQISHPQEQQVKSI